MHGLVCYGQRAGTAVRHSILILDVKSHDGRARGSVAVARCRQNGPSVKSQNLSMLLIAAKVEMRGQGFAIVQPLSSLFLAAIPLGPTLGV